MFGSHVLQCVGFVEDDEIILEQDAAFQLLVHTAQQSKKQSVVDDDHVRREDAVARALEKTDAVLLAEIGLVTADFRRAQSTLRTYLRPDSGVRLDLEV